MDYLSIHDRTITYLRSSLPRDRLRRRNPTDLRLLAPSLYIEMHHIIPRSLGGLDDPRNLVEVLPEEHVFLHMLRYKVYRQREDALAVRFMLNGFDAKSVLADTRVALTKQLRMGYAWLRTHAQLIRTTHGWHTLEGAARISKARLGQMPAKDAVTGVRCGMVSTTHPKVLSGEWVHHSKGRPSSAKARANMSIAMRGQSNSNASGLSEAYFVDKGAEAFREFGVILSWRRMLELSRARDFAWIKSLKSRFGGAGLRGYYAAVAAATGAPYDPYLSRTIRPKGQPLC